MANKSEKAAAAVEALFKKKPDASTDEFLEVAVAADPSLKGVGKRSFNATYLLPMKRAAGGFKKKTKKKRATKKKAKATRRAGGRKKTGRRKARGRRGGANGAVSPAARERVRELILDRDRQVLDTVGREGDAQAAYELGARLDSYIDELAAAMGQ